MSKVKRNKEKKFSSLKEKKSKDEKFISTTNKLEFSIYYINAEDYFKMSNKERVNKIIYLLKNRNIIVIDAVLPPSDELEIIKEVINNVDNSFKGIEISTIKKKENNWLNKFLLKKQKGLTIIGPSNIIKKLEKEGDNLIKMEI